MDFLKPLLANLFTVLTLDTKDLGKNLAFGIGMTPNLTVDTTYVYCHHCLDIMVTTAIIPFLWQASLHGIESQATFQLNVS